MTLGQLYVMYCVGVMGTGVLLVAIVLVLT